MDACSRSSDGRRRVRWPRFDPRRTLARRSDAELPFIGEKHIAGRALLLDTCVYIDQLQDRSPDILDRLVATRQVNHSTVVIQELMHTVGVLDPADPRTPRAVAEIRSHIRSMPPHRIVAPDVDTLGRGALLTGIVCRLQGYAADRKLRALHACVLLLHARKLDLTLLTANVADFDILLQLLQSGRALFYRRE